MLPSEERFVEILTNIEMRLPTHVRYAKAKQLVDSAGVDLNKVYWRNSFPESVVYELFSNFGYGFNYKDLLQVIQLLLDLGFDPRSNQGASGAGALFSLAWAGVGTCHRDQCKAFRLLIDAGADPFLQCGSEDSPYDILGVNIGARLYNATPQDLNEAQQLYAADWMLSAFKRHENIAGYESCLAFEGETIREVFISQAPDGGRLSVPHVGSRFRGAWPFSGMLLLGSENHVLCIDASLEYFVNDHALESAKSIQKAPELLTNTLIGSSVRNFEPFVSTYKVPEKNSPNKKIKEEHHALQIGLQDSRKVSFRFGYNEQMQKVLPHIRISRGKTTNEKDIET